MSCRVVSAGCESFITCSIPTGWYGVKSGSAVWAGLPGRGGSAEPAGDVVLGLLLARFVEHLGGRAGLDQPPLVRRSSRDGPPNSRRSVLIGRSPKQRIPATSCGDSFIECPL